MSESYGFRINFCNISMALPCGITQVYLTFSMHMRKIHSTVMHVVVKYSSVGFEVFHYSAGYRVTRTCVSKLTIIGSDNGLSPGRRQAIIWTNAGILSIGPLGTNFSEILIGNQTFSFRKLHLKMSSALASILSRPQWVNGTLRITYDSCLVHNHSIPSWVLWHKRATNPLHSFTHELCEMDAPEQK